MNRKFRKLRIGATVLILALFFTPLSQAADILGASDTTYRIDYVGSFFDRVANYTSVPWKIDPDSSKVESAVNDARLEITSRFSDASQRVDTIATTAALWYALSSDCIEIFRVSEFNTDESGEIGLDLISINSIGMKTSPSDVKPKYYAVWGNRVYFDPNNQAGDTLFIYYQARANKLTADSTICNVTKKYYDLIINTAIVNFFMGRQGVAVDGIVKLAQKRYDEILAKLNVPEVSQTPEIMR